MTVHYFPPAPLRPVTVPVTVRCGYGGGYGDSLLNALIPRPRLMCFARRLAARAKRAQSPRIVVEPYLELRPAEEGHRPVRPLAQLEAVEQPRVEARALGERGADVFIPDNCIRGGSALAASIPLGSFWSPGPRRSAELRLVLRRPRSCAAHPRPRQ